MSREFDRLRAGFRRRGYDLRRATDDERRRGFRYYVTLDGRDHAGISSLARGRRYLYGLPFLSDHPALTPA